MLENHFPTHVWYDAKENELFLLDGMWSYHKDIYPCKQLKSWRYIDLGAL